MHAADIDRERAKERGHDVFSLIDAAFERGEISPTEWHERILAVVEPAYLDAATDQEGAGRSGR